MTFKVKVNGKLEGEPIEVEIEIAFEKGEYVEVIKEMPSIIKQINKTFKG